MYASIKRQRRKLGKRLIAITLAATMLIAAPLQAAAQSEGAKQLSLIEEAFQPLLEDLEFEAEAPVAEEGEEPPANEGVEEPAADGKSLEIPVLNPLKPYTNSKSLVIEGTSIQGARVTVWVRKYSDSYRGGTATADENGYFQVPITVSSEGPYSFYALAQYSDGSVSPASLPVHTEIDISAPEDPMEGKWISPNASQIEVSWKAPYKPEYPVLYHIHRNGVKVGETSLLYFLDEGLSEGTIYEYEVYGVDAAGNLSDALEITATTTRSDIQRVSSPEAGVIRGTAISPDGKTVAFVEEKDSKYVLHVKYADEQEEHLVETEVGGPFYDIQFSEDGRYTLFSAQTEGYDHYTEHVFSYDRSTRLLSQITEGPESTYMFQAREDGRYIVYLQDSENYGDPDILMSYDLNSNSRTQLPLPEPWGDRAVVKGVSADARYMLYALPLPETGEGGDTELYRHSFDTGETILLSEAFPDTEISLSADGKTAVYEDNGIIYFYALETNEHTELIRNDSKFKYRMPVISADGSTAVFRFEDLTPTKDTSVSNDGLRWLNLTTGELGESFIHPGYEIEDYSWHIDAKGAKLIYDAEDVTRRNEYGWFPSAAYVYCMGGVCSDVPPDEGAAIDSFTWKAAVTGSEAELGSEITFLMEGAAGMQSHAVVSYKAWMPDYTGTEERTSTVALAEASEGVYQGVFKLEEGIQELTAIKAIAEKDGKQAEEQASRLPIKVSGRLDITLTASDPADLEGAMLVGWSEAKQSGNRSTAIDGTSLQLPLQASDDYQLRLLDAQGGKLAQSGLEPIVIRNGVADTYSMSVQIPAAMEVLVTNADGDRMPNIPLVLSDPVTKKTLSAAATDSEGRAAFAYGYVGEDVSITAEVWRPYITPDVQTVTLGKNTKVQIVVQNLNGTVSGTVRDESGKPVAGATVMVTQPGFTKTAVTDSLGTYKMIAPRGTSTIEAYQTETPFLRSRGYEQISVSERVTKDMTLFSNSNGHVDIKLYSKLIDTDWEQIELNRSALQSYRLQVTGEKNRPVSYKVTTNRILFVADPGETLNLCISKLAGNEQQGDCESVRLDDQRKGAVELRLMESSAITGKVVFDPKRFYSVSVLVQPIDDSGKRIGGSAYQVTEDFKLSVPKAGRYAVEFTGRPRSSDIKSVKVYKEVEVGEEQFIELGEVEIKEGGLFVGRANFLTSSLAEVLAGGTFTLRGSYKNETGRGLADSEIILVIPSGTSLIDDSVIHNGIAVTPEKRSDAEYAIHVGNMANGQIGAFSYKLRVDSDAAEHVRAEARIAFTFGEDGARMEETIGTTLLRVTKVTISAPDRISRLTFEVSGRAPAGSKVLIYDQGHLLGEAEASTGGYYARNVTIEDIPLNPYHALKAIAVHNGAEMHSEELIVQHDPAHPQPVELTVFQGETKRTVDITKGKLRLSMQLDDRDPLMFALKFNEPDKVENVVIYSGKHGFPATYDAKKKLFYAAQPPPIQVIAEPISVTYDLKPDPFRPSDMTNDEIAEALYEALPRPMQEWKTEVVPPDGSAASITSSRISGPTVLIGSSSNSAAKGKVSVGAEDVPNFVPDPLKPGQPPVYNLSYSIKNRGDGGMTVHLEFIVPNDQAAAMGYASLINKSGKFTKIDMSLEANLEGVSDLYDVIESALEYQDTYDEISDLLHKVETADCMPMDRIKYHAREAEELIDHLSTDLVLVYTLQIVGIATAASGVGVLAGLGIAALSMVLEEALEQQWEEVYDKFKNNLEADIKAALESPECKTDDDPTDPPTKPEPPTNAPVPGDLIGLPTWIFDPSGYVFEAVPSNRLEGVTATVMEKDPSTGEYHYWNAEWFDQQNPQITGSNGRYGWDVPVGTWQVEYRKEGYEPAQSAELVVLPPHFDVNIPMVSLAPPTVESIYSQDQDFLIEFSKYMVPATVTADKLKLMRGGEQLPFTIEPANAEADLEGRTFASAYRIKVTSPLSEGDIVTVTVDPAVFSYAQVPMLQPYTADVTVTIGTSVPEDVVRDIQLISGTDGVGLIWSEEERDLVRHLKAYWKSDASDLWLELEIPTGVGTYWFGGLNAGESYTFRLVTVDLNGNESEGVTIYGKPIGDETPEDRTPPGDVSEFAAAADNSGLKLTWKDPSDDDFYRVLLQLRRVGDDQGKTIYVEKGAQTYTFTELDAGTYEVRAAAEDLNGNASAGVEKVIDVPASTPVSESPHPANISIANNLSGRLDTITVTGLKAGDLISVYRTADDADKLGEATVAEGQTSAIVKVLQLGAESGQVYVSVTSLGKLESARVVKAYSAEPGLSDGVAPVTKFRLIPVYAMTNTGRPYIKGFTVSLLALDNEEGSGVSTTQYRINGGGWMVYTAPFEITAGIAKTVEYFSTDHAGNSEMPINTMDFVKGTFEGAGSY
ncbi:carboxypeptidase regulatory-like domain-containing protein [Paenibacillus nanensis]|nr:carboxypeptidase regulatory-like domain-containing protein [Paenibacillus nanensis]